MKWEYYTVAIIGSAVDVEQKLDEFGEKGWELFEREGNDFLFKRPVPELPEGLEEAAKEYRDFREKCGVNDPVMLDEIEEAHYAGSEWMAEHGESHEGVVTDDGMFIKFKDDKWMEMIALDPTLGLKPPFKLKDGDKVIVQIRRKI